MKLSWATFISVICLASTAEIRLGSSACTWGPSYWCSGFSQSRECGATTHCISRVWSQRQLPQDNDEVCDVCKNMVKEARDSLESNMTLEELKEVFEGSCALLPVKVIREECDKLVDQFIPELVETLASQMNPDLVCATAGLCNSARIDHLLNAYYSTQPQKTECQMCEVQARNVVANFRSTRRHDIMDKLLEMCGYLSSYSDACKATVLDNFQNIYSTLYYTNERDFCDSVGMCSTEMKQTPAVYHSTRKGDIECEFCEKVIKHWVDTWTSKTTEEEFKEVLDGLCKKLDSADRVKHCLHIVDDWYMPWFEFLLHEINPRQICSMAGLCGRAGFMKVDSRTSITLLLPPGHRHEVDQMDQDEHDDEAEQLGEGLGPLDVSQQGLIGGYFAPRTALEANKPGCAICLYAMTELINWIGNNKTEAEVERDLDELCQKLPSTVEDQCQNLVDTYGPAIVQMIINDLDPSEVCSKLHLCPSQSGLLASSEESQEEEMPSAIDVIKSKDNNCALCEFAMEYVFQSLNDTQNQEMVKNVLDTVCYHLPQRVQNKCVKLVDGYTDEIIQLIVNAATPDEICQLIHVCTRKDTPPPKKSDQECALCEFAVTTLDKIIGDKHNEEEVKEALDKLCGYMPKSISQQCTQFVDTYSELIIDMITNDLTPDQVCAQLGLCQSKFVTETSMPETGEAESAYCTLCEYAVAEMDKAITDRENEEEVKRELDALCDRLSAPISDKCTKMVDTYYDQVVEMIVTQYTPEEICVNLRLCQPSWIEDNGMHFELTNELPPLEDDTTIEVISPGTNLIVHDKPLCVICEYVMVAVGETIGNNRTVDIVERAVQLACSILPTRLADQCHAFVDHYEGEIVRLLVEMRADPGEVCSQLKLCLSSPDETNALFDARSVGGKKCAFGPSYWCKTPFHAKLCGTTRHCQTYVWQD